MYESFAFKEPTAVINGEEFVLVMEDHDIIKAQREALGMTQQQVADKAHINIRQYQRYESGERSLASASFRIGVSICKALDMDAKLFS